MRKVIFTSLLGREGPGQQDVARPEPLPGQPRAGDAYHDYLDADLTSSPEIHISAVRSPAGAAVPPHVALGRVMRFKLPTNACADALATIAGTLAMARVLNRIAATSIGADPRTGKESYRLSAKQHMLTIQSWLDQLPVAPPRCDT